MTSTALPTAIKCQISDEISRVVTHPNAISSKNQWYHGFFDKINLTMIGGFEKAVTYVPEINGRTRIHSVWTWLDYFSRALTFLKGLPWTRNSYIIRPGKASSSFLIRRPWIPRNGIQSILFQAIIALELTALSFTFAMVAIFGCWYPKSAVLSPGQVNLDQIRSHPRSHLPTTWHCTPLDDIISRIFCVDAYWFFFNRLGDMMHLHPCGRPIKPKRILP
ncbi:hypothetical protein JMJ77_0008316 [Colletotrichum scovillei]|uniref:Uncharacterized protein n=1 Tax=Colletotrichum scovillei TaxID=1209932 RepID=A0A9P7REL3_9PEZI|nr:hypothetical protein JMJ77_0008316 [Colletotrichum scovillei]KAG7075346.1 hypothetical protein JMJ76_0011806 [Colletotrichum scovillei]KAG7082329.1 hypothetical protein JMJ78_0004432 [Colletotrichum scovillei]